MTPVSSATHPIDPDSRSESEGYGRTARRLHWLVVALLAVQFLSAWLLPHIKMDTPVDTVIGLHFSLGLVIAVVMAARLVHRWRNPVAVAPGDSPAWQRLLARATHLAFYVVLIAGPFLGWAAASAHGVAVRLFGLIPLPALAPRRAAWALEAGDIHGVAMWTLLGLVGLHAAAALYHHFVRHDGVLLRMWPRAARRG